MAVTLFALNDVPPPTVTVLTCGTMGNSNNYGRAGADILYLYSCHYTNNCRINSQNLLSMITKHTNQICFCSTTKYVQKFFMKTKTSTVDPQLFPDLSVEKVQAKLVEKKFKTIQEKEYTVEKYDKKTAFLYKEGFAIFFRTQVAQKDFTKVESSLLEVLKTTITGKFVSFLESWIWKVKK